MVGALGLWVATPSGQQPAPRRAAVDGEVLVRFRNNASASRRDAAIRSVGGTVIRDFESVGVHHLRVPRGRSLDSIVASLEGNPDIAAAQPNYERTAVAVTPNDQFFSLLWGLTKIQMPDAWTYSTGSNAIVVADIDSGVRYAHPDLTANMWMNPGEIPGNHKDDDGNGYVDDVYGIDAYNHDSNPLDDNGHGTHTSGTIGAVGNNTIGVVGVNWNVKILACKFLNAAGSGSDAGAIECLNYVTWLRNHGINIRVTSNSWGGERGAGPEPILLKAAFDAAGNAGIINIVAAGNGDPVTGIGFDIDTRKFDPASLDSPSIVAVAASDKDDDPAVFSNFGVVSVDLAAPGVMIGSTYWSPSLGNSYVYADGTSMATPHVAGVAALLAAITPGATVSGLRSLLLNSVTPLPGSWASTPIATNGRLNAYTAATALVSNPPPSVSITAPALGSIYAAPATVNVTASAIDSNGSVTKVEFYRNGVLTGTDTTAPYAASLAGLAAGSYSLTAKATDDMGGSTTSSAVVVTVVSSTPPSAGLAPASVAFAAGQQVGTSSAAQVITVTNGGPGSLVFTLFNGGVPAASFVAGADFPVTTDCPLAWPGLASGGTCHFNVVFAPVGSGPRTASITVKSNDAASPHVIPLSGTAFAVDEPTITATIAAAAGRLRALQNADGGWYFKVTDTSCGSGVGVSCPNLFGVNGLALLSDYARTANAASLAAAVAAGNALLAQQAAALAQVPPTLPRFQDLEFMADLSAPTASGNPAYLDAATDWFAAVIDQYPNAADRVDAMIAAREAIHRRTLAAWDAASFIRTAKAVGQLDYALAAAARIVEREADWKDVDPAHRWDQCEIAAGCGPADNPLAFDYTLLGMGSLLWSFHDLPGFDATVAPYRAHLVAQQDAEGGWDVGNAQISAYVMMGLGAVGGADTAMTNAASFFIVTQLATNGWPSYVSYGFTGSEYTEVDAEVARGLDRLFNTLSGSSVGVTPGQLSTVTFGSVTTAGATTVVALESPAAVLPFGYTRVEGLSYQVGTTAAASGGATVCFAVPWEAAADFANIRLLHAEGGALVDRTILFGPHAPDALASRVCAAVAALDGFVVARRDASAVDTQAPALSVTLPATIGPARNQLVAVVAQVVASDNADPSPAVTLVSIASNERPRRGRGGRPDVVGAEIGTDDRAFLLRAERGRVYTVTYRATDAAGNRSTVTRNIVVR